MTLQRILTAAGLALAFLALGTCSNPFDLVKAVETEVKVANNKFLVVDSITPAHGATDVNPGVHVTVVFDRELDEDTISDSAITITPSVPLDFDYTAATKTLQIAADPYMEDNTVYTMQITGGLKGADGSQLQEERAWSFTTGQYPAGNVTMGLGDPLATNSTSVTLYFTFKPVVDKYRYSLISEVDLASQSYVATVATLPVSLGGSDGTKTVWVQYRDDGTSEESTVQSDSIILDRAAPTVSSFLINSSATGTSSPSVTLYNGVSDLTPMQMRFQNAGGGWSSWEDYSSTKSWSLLNSVGTRVVNAEFRDVFSQTAAASDSIIYGTVTVQAATLNTTPTAGTVMVTWSAATADTGTNYYYVYRRDYPGGAGKPIYTYLGRATSTAATNLTVGGVPEGTLYYFDVRIYNTAVGGYGYYSTTSQVGFTADVTIVYNDSNSTDTTLAARMQSFLTTDLANHPTYGSSIDGTMPSWTVMLVPQSFISTTTYEGTYRSTVVGGHPIILTPGISYYSDPEWVRNVVMHDRGVFAMGYGGTRLLDTVNANFTGWGMTGTKPADIGWGPSASGFPGLFITTQTLDSVWNYPLYSSGIPGGATPTNNASVQISYADIPRISVYRGTDTSPAGGALYGREYPTGTYPHYYPVVRQGRFLQFGFTREPDRPYTGWVYMVNLTYRMGTY